LIFFPESQADNNQEEHIDRRFGESFQDKNLIRIFRRFFLIEDFFFLGGWSDQSVLIFSLFFPAEERALWEITRAVLLFAYYKAKEQRVELVLRRSSTDNEMAAAFACV